MTARKIGLRIATKLHASEGNLANIQLATANWQLGYDGRGAEDEDEAVDEAEVQTKAKDEAYYVMM